MRKGQLTVWLLSLLCTIQAYTQQSNNLPGLTTYFEEAYWRYPNIPKGVLEAAAYSASRFTNLHPQHNDHNNCTGMPERYGLFGLVENGRGYFKNNLLRICEASGITPEQYKKDVRLQILAVAKFLGREATARRMSIQVSAEEFAAVVERLSEIPDDKSVLNTYAQALYIYDIYDHLQKGFLSYPAVPVDMSRIFPEPVLRTLKAKEITITDSVTLGKQPVNSKTTSVAIHTLQGTYAGAVSWFANTSAKITAQYIVRSSDGQITQLVRNTGSSTIGIEHEGFVDQGAKWYTDKLYQSSAALVREICDSAKIDKAACYRGASTATTNFQPTGIRVKGHQHYSGNIHTDPGKYWNWNKYADLLLDKTSSPEPAARFITIPDGVYRLTNVSTLKVMNAREGSSKVTQLGWSGNDAQRWQFENSGDGWYIITNKMNGRVLEAPACSQEIMPVMLYELKSHDCQKWRLFQTGKNQVRLVNKASGKVLEVAAGANANESIIQQNNWSYRNWQKWMLMPVSANHVPAGVYRLRVLQSGKVLCPFSCAPLAGTTMQQWEWKGISCQRWQVEGTADGFFRISQRQNGLVLDVDRCNADRGNAIMQHNWQNTDCQKWAFEKVTDSTWKISSKSSGKVLDVADNNNGTAVNQWDWNGSKNQQWVLELVKGEDSMAVAPNPIAGNEIRVNYFLNNTAQTATFLLSDTYGRIVQQRRVPLQQGANKLTINTSNLKAGVYLVTIQLDGMGGGVSRKIIKP